MSLSVALNNASLGLVAASRLAETVSNNVANATTPGYGRRVTELSSVGLGGYGGGVRVTGTTRTESPFVTAERRAMDASLGATGTLSATYERIVGVLGEPGSAGSLVSRATALETTLMAAVSEPQSLSRLSDAVAAAKGLAQSVNAVAAENVRLRTEANAEIARQVRVVNDALHAVREVNEKIGDLQLRGQDVNGLIDERDRIIDRIATIVPIRAVNRDVGEVALYTANGGVLLDGRVFELRFDQGPSVVGPQMTVGGQLSALSQDQGMVTPVVIAAGSGAGFMDGGSLGALFEARDRTVPEFDAEMDAYAQDLIDRFRDLMPAGALDAASDGLFVDSAPGSGAGLAGRLVVNAAADPAQGGYAWRLRDGLAAVAPGDEGFGTYLQGLADAMTAARTPNGFVSQNAANGAALIASEITSFFAGKSARSDDARAYLTSRQTVLADSEANLIGVNTDNELQSLMVIEQAYAANARVLTTIDSLLKLLLEM